LSVPVVAPHPQLADLQAGGTDGPPFDLDPVAQAVLEQLWDQGHAALVVGGGVRDALLGLPTGDWDVATDARPERILEVFPDGSYENRFGTVLARGVEITTFRRDHHYADHRRPERVIFTDDVYEDLARRDLTINAIAWGRGRPGSLTHLLDPTDGLSDLRAGLVRAVGDPEARFDEDALRLLRAVRVAARLGFDLEPLTYAAVVAHAPDVAWVSEERIGSEVRRMLRAATPSRAFGLLRQTGILHVILPELAALGDRPAFGGPGGDALDRSLAGLDAATTLAPGVERVALAALLSGVGQDAPGAVGEVLRRLRVSAREVETVERLVVAAAGCAEGVAWSDAELRRFMRRTGRDLLDDMLTLRAALDASAGVAVEEGGSLAVLRERVGRQLGAGVPLSLSDLAVDGHDLADELGLAEGPAVGVILDRLLDTVLDDPSLNDRSALLQLARGWLAGDRRGAPHGVGCTE
jgi:tRNA nucleotidyltransferase (CCA-adding enzyme)